MHNSSQKPASYADTIIDYLKSAPIPLNEVNKKQVEENLINYFKDIQNRNQNSDILITSDRFSGASDSQKEYIGEIFSSALKQLKKDNGHIGITLSKDFFVRKLSLPSPPDSTTPAIQIDKNKFEEAEIKKFQNILGGETVYNHYKDQIGEKNMAFYQNFMGSVDNDRIKEQISRHAGAVNSYPEMKPIYEQRIEKIKEGLRRGYTLDQSEREMNNFRRLTEEQGQMKKAFEVFTNMVAGNVSGDKGDNQLMLDILGRSQNPSGQGLGLAAQQPPTRQAPSLGGGFGGGTNGLSRSSSSKTTPSVSPSLRPGNREMGAIGLLNYVGDKIYSADSAKDLGRRR